MSGELRHARQRVVGEPVPGRSLPEDVAYWRGSLGMAGAGRGRLLALGNGVSCPVHIIVATAASKYGRLNRVSSPPLAVQQPLDRKWPGKWSRCWAEAVRAAVSAVVA